MSTLIRSVDSIVVQDCRTEVILVDDGSTDGSSELCDNIKHQYEDETCSIIVVHQANQGLSAARNAGIAIATGELITFVDSDDYVAPDTYRENMHWFEDDDTVDVVEFPVDRFYNVITERSELNFTVHKYNDNIKYLYHEQVVMHAYAWNKIYRARLFDSPLFATGRAFEDLFALPLWLEKARRIVTSDRGCYFYTLNNNGICRTAGTREYQDRLDAIGKLLKWIPDNKRHGKGYAVIFEQAMNLCKDIRKAGGTPCFDFSLAPSLSDMSVRCIAKYLRELTKR